MHHYDMLGGWRTANAASGRPFRCDKLYEYEKLFQPKKVLGAGHCGELNRFVSLFKKVCNEHSNWSPPFSIDTDLLRQFDLFLPRINFGKPVNTDGSPSLQRSQSADGFSYLKRDLVRLLGVLCHGERAVQDRTRMAGGLPVVMNQCVIDERNPCMQTFFHQSCSQPSNNFILFSNFRFTWTRYFYVADFIAR